MDVPKGPNEVAWFDLGPRPGENGSAVIAGHYGWKNNVPAVFDDLHKLRKGDKIYFEDEKGAITTFVVREIRTYTKDEAAPDVFGSSDGKAHLNLVTCTGAWNEAEETRSERLVVFTDKE
jgi:LPXTG-site transpeptidase (sortase) family protein